MTGPQLQFDLSWQNGAHMGAAAGLLPKGVTALIGPSGAGKTTLARLIAGLQPPTEGTIKLGGETLFDSASKTCAPPEMRGIGFVPQDPALFPHMTVKANIGFAARADEGVINEYIRVANIGSLLERTPHTLSGGEARRVAIVRALASAPRLLILDEPMTGLDPKRKNVMMALVRTIARTANIPILLITHQLDEMLTTADHAMLMNDCQLVTSGTIEDVLSAPQTADLLHLDDAGAVLEVSASTREDGLITASLGDCTLYLPDDGEAEGARLRLRVLGRDVAIALNRQEQISIVNQLECQLEGIEKCGGGYILTLRPQGADATIVSRITQKSHDDLALVPEMTVYALIKAVAVKELVVDTPAR